MRRTIRLTAAAFALSCAGATCADAGGMGMGRLRGPTFLRQLFPPTLIMQHQSDIGLTAAQRDAITKEMTDTQKAVLDLRWQLEEKTTALTNLLSADKVDENAAMTQVDTVLKLEDQLKRLRLGFLIRVKNVLTPSQQDALRKLQAGAQRERHGRQPGGDAAGSEGLEP
jgi:Spy/CpxP family protein refolding chaperone